MNNPLTTIDNVPNPTGVIWETPVQQVVSKKKPYVAIVGFASSTREKAPFASDLYEIWGLNQLYRHIPRADRWFDIHENYDEGVVEGTDHIGWLRSAKIPVYMNKQWEDYPTSIEYPIDKVIEYFGRDYFTSTIAYMLALAIIEKFERIEIYGVDLIVGTEWEEQRQCAEYYIGWAKGAGIDVYIPKESALLSQQYRYGYQSSEKSIVKKQDFAIRHDCLKEKRNSLRTRLAIVDGALQEAEYRKQNPLTSEETEKRIVELQNEHDRALVQVAMLDGALTELEYWEQFQTLRSRGGTVNSSE